MSAISCAGASVSTESSVSGSPFRGSTSTTTKGATVAGSTFIRFSSVTSSSGHAKRSGQTRPGCSQILTTESFCGTPIDGATDARHLPLEPQTSRDPCNGERRCQHVDLDHGVNLHFGVAQPRCSRTGRLNASIVGRTGCVSKMSPTAIITLVFDTAAALVMPPAGWKLSRTLPPCRMRRSGRRSNASVFAPACVRR